jgi:excisionase family DNA binding protein
MDQPDRSTLSAKRAAQLLGISVGGVHFLIRTGKLAAVKEGRVYAIPAESVCERLAERAAAAEAHRRRLHEGLEYLARLRDR